MITSYSMFKEIAGLNHFFEIYQEKKKQGGAIPKGLDKAFSGITEMEDFEFSILITNKVQREDKWVTEDQWSPPSVLGFKGKTKEDLKKFVNELRTSRNDPSIKLYTVGGNYKKFFPFYVAYLEDPQGYEEFFEQSPYSAFLMAFIKLKSNNVLPKKTKDVLDLVTNFCSHPNYQELIALVLMFDRLGALTKKNYQKILAYNDIETLVDGLGVLESLEVLSSELRVNPEKSKELLAAIMNHEQSKLILKIFIKLNELNMDVLNDEEAIAAGERHEAMLVQILKHKNLSSLLDAITKLVDNKVLITTLDDKSSDATMFSKLITDAAPLRFADGWIAAAKAKAESKGEAKEAKAEKGNPQQKGKTSSSSGFFKGSDSSGVSAGADNTVAPKSSGASPKKK